ncbi:MAG: hypothetical protein K0Q47_59 [Sedimentibacter sp.]|jgi:hypothetical protein|nr:hypothetical protein [Sedimentibacter sp.]
MSIDDILENFFEEEVEIKKSLSQEEVKKAYNKSTNIKFYKGERKDLTYIGLIFETYQDINIYVDQENNYWADYFSIGD